MRITVLLFGLILLVVLAVPAFARPDVPEPSSLAMMSAGLGLGLVALVARWRRRKG